MCSSQRLSFLVYVSRSQYWSQFIPSYVKKRGELKYFKMTEAEDILLQNLHSGFILLQVSACVQAALRTANQGNT